MDIQPTFVDCPAYLNQQDLHRCGLPAEVKCRFIMTSTSGPLESAMIRCPVGHFFNGPIEFLSLERHPGVCSRSASQTMSTSIGQPAEVGHDPD